MKRYLAHCGQNTWFVGQVLNFRTKAGDDQDLKPILTDKNGFSMEDLRLLLIGALNKALIVTFLYLNRSLVKKNPCFMK